MPAPAPPIRKIIHVDMDAFYASVEVRDDARLRGLPLAVAWEGPRGVVLTASYPARAFGVRSAMPVWKAKRLCPDLRLVPPRFEAYRAVSGEIRSIFLGFTPLVEPLSLDEAYLDVTEPLRGGPSATRIAQAIRAEIRAATGLTATAGVSVNKFLAKLASGLHKPDGLTVILPGEAQALLDGLPVADFHGIGPATQARLAAHGIHNGADLRAQRREDLLAWFGRLGEHFYHLARGQDERPVEADRPYKSIGAEETTGRDLRDRDEVRALLPALAATVSARLAAAGLCARTVVLKLKYADFSLTTRRVTLGTPISSAAELEGAADRLLSPELLAGRQVRLVGITASGLAAPGKLEAQGRLFEVAEKAP